MQAPDHDARQSGRLSFEDDQIADAGLVQTAAVVDDEHVTRPGLFQDLEKDVHAAHVPGGRHAAGQAAGGHNGPQRGTAQRNPGAQAGVSQVRCGQCPESPLEFQLVHTGPSWPGRGFPVLNAGALPWPGLAIMA